MKRIFARSLLAIASITASSQVFGDCDEDTKDLIRKSGGNREAAVAQTKKMVLFHKNNKSGPFWTKTKNQKEREEMFAALEDNANEIVKNIRSCTDSDLASIAPNTKTSQSGGAASNCPSEYSWPFSAGCGSKLRVLPNGHLLHNGCPEAGEPWKDEGEIGASNDRRGLGWPGLDEFYECHLAARKRSSVTANSGAASTQSGPNVGNASEVIGQRSNRKNAFNPSSPQGASAQSQSAHSDGECQNGDPSCAIRDCNRSGGKAIAHRDNLGCGVVSCRYADSKRDWSSIYNRVPGVGCSGSTK